MDHDDKANNCNYGEGKHKRLLDLLFNVFLASWF